MSVMLRPVNPYHGNINVFETLEVGDVGDAPVVPGYMLESLESMEAVLAGLAERGVVPAAIGGDHGIALEAFGSPNWRWPAGMSAAG